MISINEGIIFDSPEEKYAKRTSKIKKEVQERQSAEAATKKLKEDLDAQALASHKGVSQGSIKPEEHEEFMKAHNAFRKAKGLPEYTPPSPGSPEDGSGFIHKVAGAVSDHPLIAAGLAVGAGFGVKHLMDKNKQASQSSAPTNFPQNY
jgi:hypothetical protein